MVESIERYGMQYTLLRLFSVLGAPSGYNRSCGVPERVGGMLGNARGPSSAPHTGSKVELLALAVPPPIGNLKPCTALLFLLLLLFFFIFLLFF